MATATKKTTRTVSKGPHKATKAAAKKAPAKKVGPSKAKTSKKSADVESDEELEWMEVPKKAKKAAKKFPKLDLKPLKVAAKTVGKGKKAKKVKVTKLSPTMTINHVTEATGLSRKDVKLVLETLADTVKAAIMPGGVGGAFIPGIGAVIRKAVKARKIPAIKRGTIVEKRTPGSSEVQKFKHPGRPASTKPATSKARFILKSNVRRAVFGTN